MNIAEILKNAPKGTKLYSPIFGECKLDKLDENSAFPIIIKYKNIVDNKEHIAQFTYCGRFTQNGECVLFPSKENRDWNTFKIEKSYEFKPFDKVLVRNEDTEPWCIEWFGFYDEDAKEEYPYICSANSTSICNAFKQCIPFEGNEKLLGHYDKV